MALKPLVNLLYSLSKTDGDALTDLLLKIRSEMELPMDPKSIQMRREGGRILLKLLLVFMGFTILFSDYHIVEKGIVLMGLYLLNLIADLIKPSLRNGQPAEQLPTRDSSRHVSQGEDADHNPHEPLSLLRRRPHG